MKHTVFLCVGGDARQTYTGRALAACGKVYSYGIHTDGNEVIRLESLDAMEEKADVLVLPIMKQDGLKIACADGKNVYCTELPKHLEKGALVVGGRLSILQIEYFSALGFDVADYFKREELVIKNCIPTAEGALQIAMQETGACIFGSNVLVIGYGRVGKATAKLFKAVGANTAVAARRLSSIAEAENYGMRSFDINEMYGHIPGFSVIINTVPAMVLDNGMLEAVAKNAVIIDLASKPGGVDFEAANQLNRRVVWALSLPGRVAPITSGEIIADAVRNIILERGRKNA